MGVAVGSSGAWEWESHPLSHNSDTLSDYSHAHLHSLSNSHYELLLIPLSRTHLSSLPRDPG